MRFRNLVVTGLFLNLLMWFALGGCDFGGDEILSTFYARCEHYAHTDAGRDEARYNACLYGKATYDGGAHD